MESGKVGEVKHARLGNTETWKAREEARKGTPRFPVGVTQWCLFPAVTQSLLEAESGGRN